MNSITYIPYNLKSQSHHHHLQELCITYINSFPHSIGNKGKYIYAIFLTTNLAATVTAAAAAAAATAAAAAAAATTTILNYPPKELLKKIEKAKA